MKSFILAGILVATTAGIANAQGVDVDVGRGGVHVGPDYRYRDRDDRDGDTERPTVSAAVIAAS